MSDSAFDVQKKHELYDTWKRYWQQYADFAELGPDVLWGGTYLHRHPREDAAAFAERVKRCDTYNLIPEILGTYTEYQFSTPPFRDYDSSPYKGDIEEFLSDCTGGGLSWDEFVAETVYPSCLAHGWVELFVDAPILEQQLVSVAQAKDAGVRPYVRCLSPLRRTNWSVDHVSDYHWVVLQEDPQPSIKPGQLTDQSASYLVLQRDGWARYIATKDDSGKLTYDITDAGAYGYGAVPLVPFYFRRSRKHQRFGTSALGGIMPIAQAVLNLVSQQQEDLFASFGMLTIQTSDPDVSPSELGASRVLVYPIDAKNPPQWLSAPVDHARVKQEIIDAKIEHMLRTAKLSVAMGELSAQVRTGIAGEVERRELTTMLKNMARNLERMERQLIAMVCSVAKDRPIGPEETQYNVQYPDEFRMETSGELIDFAEKVKKNFQGVSDTFTKSVLKEVAHSRMQEGDTTLDTVDGEIDAADLAEASFVPLPFGGETPEDDEA